MTNAHTVLLRWITVEGNVTLTGGGADIPWAIKNNTIGGNLTVGGQTAEWLGVLFNTIERNATLTKYAVGGTEAVFVVPKTIARNSPAWDLVHTLAVSVTVIVALLEFVVDIGCSSVVQGGLMHPPAP